MNPLRRFHEHRLFPWFNDRLGHVPALERLRGEELRAAHGRVIEIGFGTGLNLPHYPPTVTSLVAVEPNPGMLARAATRIEAAAIPVEIVAASAESLPFPDNSFDCAVSFLTLCSVSEPGPVLDELRRVLGRCGRLLLMEHGLAEEPAVARWQRRLNPLETALACGCHLDRPVARLVEDSGFRFQRVRSFYLPGTPRTHGWFTVGVALKA
jgi:SAM-dependent methyltransferase